MFEKGVAFTVDGNNNSRRIFFKLQKMKYLYLLAESVGFKLSGTVETIFS
jgi:hypothetical protein